MDMAGTYCWLRLLALVVGPGCWSMSLTHVIGEGPRFLDQFFDQVVIWVLGSWHIFLAQVSCPEGAFYKVSAQLPGPMYSMSQALAKLPGSWPKFPHTFLLLCCRQENSPLFRLRDKPWFLRVIAVYDSSERNIDKGSNTNVMQP